MKKSKLFAVALAAVLAVPAAGAAQNLPAGKWTGTAQPPGQPEVAITFDVKVAGDTIAITLNAGEHGSFKLEEVKLVKDKLTFWFVPGPKVSCSLTRREDGAYAGVCADDQGEQVPMTMVPPKKEGF